MIGLTISVWYSIGIRCANFRKQKKGLIMRKEIQEVIDGHLSISELVDKISTKESDPIKKANIINELWDELNKINKAHAKAYDEKKKSA